jgi:MotA/TolQ/ExbB proton channel family
LRRHLIRTLLPVVFCVMPPLAAALIAFAMPAAARQFYLDKLPEHHLDQLMLALGSGLFLVQIILCLQALQWRGTKFDERPDRWLSNLAQAAEWFPLLGLIGTVAGIMQTFAEFGIAQGVVQQKDIIAKYAPAITATCTGLFMALINILPTWIVLVGRDIISTLGGGAPPEPPPSEPPVAEVYQAPVLSDPQPKSRSGAEGVRR